MKHKADLHVSLAPPLTSSSMEALPSHQINEQQPSQPIQTLLSVSAPPHSQPGPAMSAITPPISSMANVVVPPTQAAASSTAACGISSTLPEIKIKQEVEPMDTSKAGTFELKDSFLCNTFCFIDVLLLLIWCTMLLPF